MLPAFWKWILTAAWLAGVLGCIRKRHVLIWLSNDMVLAALSEARAKLRQSKAISHRTELSNLKAGQKTDGNPMSAQR